MNFIYDSFFGYSKGFSNAIRIAENITQIKMNISKYEWTIILERNWRSLFSLLKMNKLFPSSSIFKSWSSNTIASLLCILEINFRLSSFCSSLSKIELSSKTSSKSFSNNLFSSFSIFLSVFLTILDFEIISKSYDNETIPLPSSYCSI